MEGVDRWVEVDRAMKRSGYRDRKGWRKWIEG